MPAKADSKSKKSKDKSSSLLDFQEIVKVFTAAVESKAFNKYHGGRDRVIVDVRNPNIRSARIWKTHPNNLHAEITGNTVLFYKRELLGAFLQDKRVKAMLRRLDEMGRVRGAAGHKF